MTFLVTIYITNVEKQERKKRKETFYNTFELNYAHTWNEAAERQ